MDQTFYIYQNFSSDPTHSYIELSALSKFHNHLLGWGTDKEIHLISFTYKNDNSFSTLFPFIYFIYFPVDCMPFP